MNGYNNCGVYAIRHLPTGQEYIGSSVNVKKRIKTHFLDLRNGKHHAYKLQECWLTSNPEDFKFEPVVWCGPQNLRMYESLVIQALVPKLNTSFFTGQLVKHPPRTKEYRSSVSISSKGRWTDPEYRAKVVSAYHRAMTSEECQNRSTRTKDLWADPGYRENAIAARKGKAYNKGYKCTPEQIENRKRAARIFNMKRNYGEGWKTEYARRYPKYIKDVQ